MGIELELWRARIGLFCGGRGNRKVRDHGTSSRLSHLQKRLVYASKNVCTPGETSNSGGIHISGETTCPGETNNSGEIPSPGGCSNEENTSNCVLITLQDVIDALFVALILYCLCYYCNHVQPIQSKTKLTQRVSYHWSCNIMTFVSVFISVVLVSDIVILSLLLIIAGDIELNPGPQGSE